jgi:thiol-disulfide isomerase/thioredoxin
MVTVVSAQVKEFKTFDSFESEVLIPKDSDTTYIINFWATWCIPCIKELPYFEELQTKNKNEKIKVILVSLDFTMEQVEKYIEKKKLLNEVVLLSDSKTNDWIDKVDPSWSGAIPITLFIKGKRRVFYEKDYENLEQLETDLLMFKNTKP